MAVAANANPSDGPLITPGTPISTPTLIDIDKRWLDLTAQVPILSRLPVLSLAITDQRCNGT